MAMVKSSVHEHEFECKWIMQEGKAWETLNRLEVKGKRRRKVERQKGRKARGEMVSILIPRYLRTWKTIERLPSTGIVSHYSVVLQCHRRGVHIPPKIG